MMRLTKATHDQIKILLRVARAGSTSVATPTLANDLGLALPNAQKLVNRLVHSKLLRAKRGAGGGVTLARSANELSLGTVVGLLEAANAALEACDWPVATSRRQTSNILDEALALFIEVLDQHTLADLMNDKFEPKRVSARRRKVSRGKLRVSGVGA